MWPYFSPLKESILSSVEAAPAHVPTAVQEAPFPPHPCRHLLLHIIRITAILTGARASSWRFDLHLPGDWRWERPVGHLCVSSGAVSIQQAPCSPLRF